MNRLKEENKDLKALLTKNKIPFDQETQEQPESTFITKGSEDPNATCSNCKQSIPRVKL